MKARVLRLLKESYPEYVSGEMVCKSLGVSRTAVWKYIQGLRADGYDIEAQPHSGYRLRSVPDRLYPNEISAGLTTSLIGREIYYFDSVDSTNRKAKELAAGGAPDGAVVVAEEQVGGKGRLGRGWFSPHGQGVWCSVILRPEVLPVDAPPLTMLAAVAVARAIKTTTGIEAGIKWPNDLLISGKKICGILTELNAEMEKINYLVLGMGLNANIEPQDIPEELKDVATSLKIETGQSVSRINIIRSLLMELEELYMLWLREGFAPVLAQWKQMCVTLNCPVRVSTVRDSWEGWTEDVDETGALILRLPDGTLQRLVAGEISLRKK